MARVNLMDFGENKHQGLWISGPRERTPATHMRRLTGVNQLRERELRTRYGTTVDAAIVAAHSLANFNNVRFQGATTILFRAGISISTGFDGTPLEFEVSAPRTGTLAEFLFVTGGGKLEKVDTAGAVTQWGIDPPDDGNWGSAVSDVGTGEGNQETTVADPQERTLGDTTTTSGWFGTPSIFISTDNVQSASGSAICQTFVEPDEPDADGPP